jgi:type VI secretion system secreted protein Hcp
VAIYMSFGKFEGDVTTSGFEKWIELSSFQWGVGRGIGSAMSGQASRESSIPSVSEVVVTKRMDKSSPKLWEDSVGGKLNSTVKIAFTTTSEGETKKFLEYEFTNTGLSGYSISSGGDMPTESLSLNFTKVEWSLTSMDPAVSGSPDKQGYDLTKAKKT